MPLAVSHAAFTSSLYSFIDRGRDSIIILIFHNTQEFLNSNKNPFYWIFVITKQNSSIPLGKVARSVTVSPLPACNLSFFLVFLYRTPGAESWDHCTPLTIGRCHHWWMQATLLFFFFLFSWMPTPIPMPHSIHSICLISVHKYASILIFSKWCYFMYAHGFDLSKSYSSLSLILFTTFLTSYCFEVNLCCCGSGSWLLLNCCREFHLLLNCSPGHRHLCHSFSHLCFLLS